MTDLRLIGTFLQAARHESFSAAAKALGISPAAVSQNIKSLEDQLGARLFQRTTRQVKLTPEGQRYLARCAPAVEALGEAAEALKSDRDSFRGHLRVTSTTSFGRRHILPAIADFQALHPDLRVELTLSDGFVDLVAEGFDLAIRGGLLPENEYVARLLLPVTMLVCGAPDYLARHGIPTTLADLARHRLVGQRSNPSQKVFAWEFGAAQGSGVERVEIEPVLVVNDPEGAALAAASGLGLAQAGSNIVLPLVRKGRLAIVLERRAVRLRGFYAVYPSRRFAPVRAGSRRFAPRRLTAFVQFLADRFADRSDLVFSA